MTMLRWKFSTLDLATTYTFEVNPNTQDSPTPNRPITWDFNPTLGFSGRRSPRKPQPWSFGGVIRTQAQYDALVTWAQSRQKVYLTDDRGDRFTIRVMQFQPTQVGSSRSQSAPDRQTYTVQALVYDFLGVT